MLLEEAIKDKTGAMWGVKDAVVQLIEIFKDSQKHNFKIYGESAVLKTVDIKNISA